MAERKARASKAKPKPKATSGKRAKKADPVEDSVVERQFEVPVLPESYLFKNRYYDESTKQWLTEDVTVKFLEQTRADWDAIWSGPLAGEYRPEDLPQLRVYIVVMDRFNHGDHSVVPDLRQLAKEWGLTWANRKEKGAKLAPIYPPKEGSAPRPRLVPAERPRVVD